MHINEAVKKSKFAAVRHHNGRISMQCDGESYVIIFVNGVQRWRVNIIHTARALAEMGLSPSDGWYPVQTDLIGLHR
jgi:hypothetical protein